MLKRSPIATITIAMLLLINPTIPAASGARVKHVARGTIQGTVTGAAGGVTVSLFKAKKHHRHSGSAKAATTPTTKLAKHHQVPLMTTVTQANGTFQFTGLPPGEYRVKAHAKHQGSGKATVVVTKQGTPSITLTLTKHQKKKAA